MFESHQVEREKLSTRERMTQVLDKIRHRQFVPFVSLFRAEEGRLGVVVTFLAVMELVKESLLELVQNESFGPIHVRARGEVEESSDEREGDDEHLDSGPEYGEAEHEAADPEAALELAESGDDDELVAEDFGVAAEPASLSEDAGEDQDTGPETDANSEQEPDAEATTPSLFS